jgi:endonuclease/exonuclease/phosphatase family metal-dependent hydrolase
MKFRLATFNIENLDLEPAGDSAFARRIAALRPELIALAADILCLQEVNAGRRSKGSAGRGLAALDRLLAGTAYADFGRSVTLNDAGTDLRDVHNLVVLSRFPILAARQVLHELVPPPRWRPLSARPAADVMQLVTWDRPIQHVRVDLGAGRRLELVNLHLRAPSPAHVAGQKLAEWRWASTAGFAEGCFLAELKRAGQALEARLLVERLFDDDPAALIAVVGDFNATGGELPTTMIRAAASNTGNPALAARELIALDAALPPRRRFSVRHGGERLMLDHLLVSANLHRAFRGAEIFNADLADELAAFVLRQRVPGSLHAPVVASFAFD